MEFPVEFLDKWNCSIPLQGNGSDWAVSIDHFGDIRAGAWNTTKMVAELAVLLDVLADDNIENDFFVDEEDDLILLAAASTFAKRNLNRIQGFFEQTIPTYSLDEFKAYFRMQRATSFWLTCSATAVLQEYR